jgi:hypothetical protein
MRRMPVTCDMTNANPVTPAATLVLHCFALFPGGYSSMEANSVCTKARTTRALTVHYVQRRCHVCPPCIGGVQALQ